MVNLRRFFNYRGIVFMFGMGLVPLAFVGVLHADESAPADSSSGRQGSENYYKSGEFLPGEEVVTPTGKRMKVWSTTGPVKVSPPPEPFSDPKKTSLDGVPIVIDAPAGRHLKDDEATPSKQRRSRLRDSRFGDGRSRDDARQFMDPPFHSRDDDE